MKKQRFSVEQIVSVLKQAEMGLPVADLIRRVGITEQTYYRWKRQYAGLESELRSNCGLPRMLTRRALQSPALPREPG